MEVPVPVVIGARGPPTAPMNPSLLAMRRRVFSGRQNRGPGSDKAEGNSLGGQGP